jgi:hypothetical protein
MDAFESLVAGLMRQQQGFWTQLNYKVNVTKEEKKEIGKPSMPRPELDILAYKPKGNVLRWIECKSYLDSYGVPVEVFTDPNHSAALRYKVFTDDKYCNVVTRRLVEQTVTEGLVLPNPKVEYCLVAGHVKSNRDEELASVFSERGWFFYGPKWLRDQLCKLADLSYENDLAVMVAKLFERTQAEGD